MRIGITGWNGFIGTHLRDRIENPVLLQGSMTCLEDRRTISGFTPSIFVANTKFPVDRILLRRIVPSSVALFIPAA